MGWSVRGVLYVAELGLRRLAGKKDCDNTILLVDEICRDTGRRSGEVCYLFSELLEALEKLFSRSTYLRGDGWLMTMDRLPQSLR